MKQKWKASGANSLAILAIDLYFCQVTRWRVTGKRLGLTWLKSRTELVGYYVYKGAGPLFREE